MLDKEALLPTADSEPSAYARPEIEPALPRQSLLIDRDRRVS
jgi:hypothetical protein